MTKLVSHAFRPQGDAESRREEMEILRRGFPLILSNLDRILRTPRFFFCQLQSTYSWTLWFGPSGPIPLGVLVLLWQDGKMIYGCPECGGRLHAVGVGGSFSGGAVWGLCADCTYNGKFNSRCWLEGFLAVARLLPLYKNEPIIEYGKRPRFDWKYGLIGETTPDKVLVPAVEPVDLPVLLAELEAADAGAVILDERAHPVAPRKPEGRRSSSRSRRGRTCSRCRSPWEVLPRTTLAMSRPPRTPRTSRGFREKETRVFAESSDTGVALGGTWPSDHLRP